MRLAQLALLLAGCGATTATTSRPAIGDGTCVAGQRVELEHDVSIECLEADVWVFTALAPPLSEIASYPANGLLVETAERSVLVDTGWIPEQAEALLAFAADVRRRPVRGAMVTHFHGDRIGGAAALTAHAIPVFSLNETAERAAAIGTPFEHRPLEPDSLWEVTWMYPGAGHSPENVVVVHAPSHTLFGGCFVKSADARDLGNLSDADVVAWEPALELVIESYPDLRHVVPGHGAPGGPELLDHTLVLVDPPECTTDADCTVTIEALEPCACCNCVDPRAMALTAIEARRAELPSCLPICEGECPACATPDELGRLVARCDAGDCTMERAR